MVIKSTVPVGYSESVGEKYNMVNPNINNIQYTVSIIVPSYNSEEFLKQCIESIYTQTFLNYEIIIIDDGSLDSTGEIADSFSILNENTRVCHCSANGGVANARNTGLNLANGKYVFFLDSDDMICENTLSELVKQAENDNLDMVFFDGQVFFESDALKKENKWAISKYKRREEYIVPRKGSDYFIQAIQNKDWRESACMIMYKKKFLSYNNLFFDEGYVHEDDLFVLKATLLAERIGVNKGIFYKRRIRSGSIMTSGNYTKRIQGKMHNISAMSSFIAEYIKKYNCSQELKTCFRVPIIKEVNSIIKMIEKIDDNIIEFVDDLDIGIQVAFSCFNKELYKNKKELLKFNNSRYYKIRRAVSQRVNKLMGKRSKKSGTKK